MSAQTIKDVKGGLRFGRMELSSEFRKDVVQLCDEHEAALAELELLEQRIAGLQDDLDAAILHQDS